MRESALASRIGLCLIVLTSVATPLSAVSAGELRERPNRPLVALAAQFGGTFQPWEADSTVTICRGGSFSPSCTGTQEPLRPSSSGDDVDSTPFIGAALEILSPEIPLPGSPRFFAGGEVIRSVGLERKVAIEGDPGPITSPIPPAAAADTSFSEDGAIGNGSETVATIGDLGFGAFAGFAFPFEWLDRDFVIRPSVNWLRFEVDIEGFASDAECREFTVGVNTVTRCVTTTTSGPGFLRETTLRGSTTETFDAIGPGIDLEMEIGRVGQFVPSLFFGARFYKILGDRKIALSDGPDSFSDVVGNDEARARFGFEVDPWIYRLGVGLRVTWLGLD